jgi:hypothetical protein
MSLADRTKSEVIERYRVATLQNGILTIQRDELLKALKECRDRLRACVIHGGTDPEFADAAVVDYDELIAKSEKPLERTENVTESL